MPPESDAVVVSPQRQIAMPSPACSRWSRKRDLVALDHDERSVEVTLGQTVHKKSVVPLGVCSTRSDFEVSLCHHERSSECISRSLPPTLC